MAKDKRILTIQDISCVGQCSLTVALPIFSAAGIETAILPSAVLSTHTAGFKGAVYTGYLGSARQIVYVKQIFRDLLAEGGVRIVDPAMADNGKLYPGFDLAFAEEMKSLCAEADIILPNITEACFITGVEYRETYDRAYIDGLLTALRAVGAKTVILTGVGFAEDKTGVMVLEGDTPEYSEHRRTPKGSHGTGDVYASAFVGALTRGKSAFDAASIAADYTLKCIENTVGDPDHWYGVKFESVLPYFIDRLA